MAYAPTTPTHTLTVVSTPGCVQCNATYRALDRKGLEYTVDLDQGSANHALAKGLGHLQAPVALIRDDEGKLIDAWGGFRPDKIAEWDALIPKKVQLAA